MFAEYTLADNGTAGPITHVGGQMHISVKGTWGSGSASIQFDMGNGYVEEEAWTADDAKVFSVPQGAEAKIVLSGASSPDLDIMFRA